MTIKKAIIPVAGFGTRFLPATKAQPKEMLTLVDKPVIQYIVEEAVSAGISQIIFVTSHSKRAIEDHFDRNFELECRLQQKQKTDELNEVMRLSELASFVYIRQHNPMGDGHAILLAKELVGDEPCAVLFGDDIVRADKPCIGQLMSIYEERRAPVIAVQKVPAEDISNYGVIRGSVVAPRVYDVTDLVEKPRPNEAPSDLAIIGRYIITPDVFSALERIKPSPDGEIRLIDAFRALQGARTVNAYEFEGRRYDCGNKLHFLTAAVDLGLAHGEANRNGAFASFIKKRAAELASTTKKPIKTSA